MLNKKKWIVSLILTTGLYAENNASVETNATTPIENNLTVETNSTVKDSNNSVKKEVDILQKIKKELQKHTNTSSKSTYNFVGDK